MIMPDKTPSGHGRGAETQRERSVQDRISVMDPQELAEFREFQRVIRKQRKRQRISVIARILGIIIFLTLPFAFWVSIKAGFTASLLFVICIFVAGKYHVADPIQ